jgi:ATP-dependent Lhr-like helicase
VNFSSDLIYDVLREHEPDHILLRATYEEAGHGLLDVARLADALKRVQGHIVTKALDRVSPLAVPALLSLPFGFPRVSIWQSLGRLTQGGPSCGRGRAA